MTEAAEGDLLDGRSADGTLFAVGYGRSALAKAAIPVVGLVLLTAYCGYLALRGDAMLAPVGVLCFVLCALAALLLFPLYARAVVRSLRGAPMISVDREGVTLHSAGISLPWSNVAEVRIERTTGQGPGAETVVFVPVDERAAVESLRGLRRRYARESIRKLGGPIALRAAQLACPVEVLAEAARSAGAVPVNRRHLPGPNPAVSR